MSSPSRQSPTLLLNTVLVLLLVCVGLLLVLRAQPPEAPVIPQDGSGWYTTAGREVLPERFIWSATVQTEPQSGDAMRCVLLGQTVRVELTVTPDGVRLSEQTGRNEARTVAERSWRHRLHKGDRIHWVKQDDGAGVFQNGVCLARIHLPHQTWARGLWQAGGGTSPFLEFSFQTFGSVHFSDDFMHPQDELGEWVASSGDWSVLSLDNPVRSANAFSLIGQGENALIMAGHWFWQDYSVAVSAHPFGTPDFGVRLCSTDAGHYAVEVRSAEDDGPATIRLVRRAAGMATVLDESAVAFSPEVWYRLRIAQLRGRLDVFVDDTRLLSAVDPNPLLGGEVGLLAFDSDGVVYDDVTISPTQRVEQDFRIQPAAADGILDFPASWAAESSLIQVPAGGGTLNMRGISLENTTFACRISEDHPLPDRFELLVRGRQVGGSWVGMRVRRTNEERTAALVHSRDGHQTVTEEVALADADLRGDYALVFRDRAVYGLHNGQTVCMAADLQSRTAGGSSLQISENRSPLVISALALRPTLEMPSLENRVETFEHEKSMSNWGSPASEWTPGPSAFGNVLWHRSDFWGSASVTLNTHAVGVDGKLPFGLVLGGDAKREAKVARLDIGVAEVGGDQLVARLMVDEEPIETVELDDVPATLGLERFSGRLQAYLDGELRWSLPLPEGLDTLGRLGRYGPGDAQTWAEALTVRGDNVMTYPFKRAPVDWTPASGTWEITNRWECDPRWSFFSGHRLKGVSCLWHKGRFPDNVTVEFFAGPKMDRSRGGHYQYAADLNAVLAADGVDINSGYSFMFGGWDDKGSFIVRENEVLAKDASMVIPRQGSTHRRWFYIKMRKQDDQLTYWVENKEIGSVRDENLLPGDRLALWTYKNGMMVAYVRVSADTVLPPETVQSVPGSAPETPYEEEELGDQ